MDSDNDGKADGIDCTGNGQADFSLIDSEDPAFLGIDLNGDGQVDYYLGKDENGEFQILLSADSSSGNEVTIVLGPGGVFVGLDTDGDGSANVDFSGNALTPPAAAQNPNAAMGDTQLTITWDAVSGADSYNLYWSTTSGTLVSNVSSPYVHKSLTNDTPYYYVVTANNAIRESVPSVEASGTPVLIPISSLTFTDANLATCVNTSGAINVSDLTSLPCDSQSISDIFGIEALTSLTSLYLYSNSITTGVADLTPLTSASSISLNGNPNMPCTDVGTLDDTLDGDGSLDSGDGGSSGKVVWDQCI